MRIRYKNSELLLIFGILICIVVSGYAAVAGDRIWRVNAGGFQYAEEDSFWIQHEDVKVMEYDEHGNPLSWIVAELDMVSLRKIEEITESLPMDVYLTFPAFIGHSGVGATITISFQKPRDRKTVQTYDLTTVREKYSKAPIVYIGETLRQYIEQKDDTQMLWVGDIAALVGGILECDNIAGYDETMIVEYGECSDEAIAGLNAELMKQLRGIDVRIRVASEKAFTGSELEEVKQAFLSAKLILHEEASVARSENERLNLRRGVQEVIFLVLLYAFAAANVLTVCNLWFSERADEIRVRRLCGARSREIAFVLTKDFFRMAGYGVILGVPVSIGLSALTGELSFRLSRMIVNAVVIAVAVGVLNLLMLARCMVFLRKLSADR